MRGVDVKLPRKDRHFNATCQQVMYRRTGPAVIGRSGGRCAQLGAVPVGWRCG